MSPIKNDVSKKNTYRIGLMAGLIVMLCVGWYIVREPALFTFSTSADELRSQLSAATPVGTPYDGVIEFLDENGVERSDDPRGGTNGYCLKREERVIDASLVKRRIFSKAYIGWSVRYVFDDHDTLAEISLAGPYP